MYVKEELDDELLHSKIKKVLLPFEYTRVDEIVNLVFETQQESDQKAQTAEQLEEADTDAPAKSTKVPKFVPQFTPKQELIAKRASIINTFFGAKKAQPEALTIASFEDAAKKLRVICTISKKYERGDGGYWYAVHPRNIEFLKDASDGYLILGCMGLDVAYALPLKFVEGLLDELNKTEKEDHYYWHMIVQLDGDKRVLNLSKVGKKIDLAPYAFEVASSKASLRPGSG